MSPVMLSRERRRPLNRPRSGMALERYRRTRGCDEGYISGFQGVSPYSVRLFIEDAALVVGIWIFSFFEFRRVRWSGRLGGGGFVNWKGI